MKVKRIPGVMFRVVKKVTVGSAVLYTGFKAVTHLDDRRARKAAELK